MTEPEPPARVTLPRSLAHAMVWLLVAHLLDSWWAPAAITARIIGTLCIVSYLYASWRWTRYANRKIREPK